VILGVLVVIGAIMKASGYEPQVIGKSNKISKVGARGPGGQLMCPRCGGTQFKPKRSASGKAGSFVVFGPVGPAMAKKDNVQCVTCGKTFTRG
jgi:hypothetical protein